jgi:hypothetical protein
VVARRRRVVKPWTAAEPRVATARQARAQPVALAALRTAPERQALAHPQAATLARQAAAPVEREERARPRRPLLASSSRQVPGPMQALPSAGAEKE